MAAIPSNGIKRNIVPPLLGWTVELPDALALKKSVEVESIDIVIVEIFVLHMKNHFIPPWPYSFGINHIQTTCPDAVPADCTLILECTLLYFGTIPK